MNMHNFKTGKLILAILLFVLPLSDVAAQDQAGEDGEELLPPDYVNADYGFGTALPENFMAFDYGDEETYIVEIMGDISDEKAQLAIEPLPEDVVDVAGYWKHMKERDPLMELNLTYEMVTSVAGTGSIQSRIEHIENGQYILVITYVFVHDGYGYVISGYPPAEGDNSKAREIARFIADQFRWMTDDEIDEWLTESTESEDEEPSGVSF